jgi:hypothetical protein
MVVLVRPVMIRPHSTSHGYRGQVVHRHVFEVLRVYHESMRGKILSLVRVRQVGKRPCLCHVSTVLSRNEKGLLPLMVYQAAKYSSVGV